MSWMTKPFSRQVLCGVQKHTAAGSPPRSRECHSSMAGVFGRAFQFCCSEESYPAERIYPAFSKFDSPGINGWGQCSVPLGPMMLSGFLRSALLLWPALYRARVLGRKLWGSREFPCPDCLCSHACFHAVGFLPLSAILCLPTFVS